MVLLVLDLTLLFRCRVIGALNSAIGCRTRRNLLSFLGHRSFKLVRLVWSRGIRISTSIFNSSVIFHAVGTSFHENSSTWMKGIVAEISISDDCGHTPWALRRIGNAYDNLSIAIIKRSLFFLWSLRTSTTLIVLAGQIGYVICLPAGLLTSFFKFVFLCLLLCGSTCPLWSLGVDSRRNMIRYCLQLFVTLPHVKWSRNTSSCGRNRLSYCEIRLTYLDWASPLIATDLQGSNI